MVFGIFYFSFSSCAWTKKGCYRGTVQSAYGVQNSRRLTWNMMRSSFHVQTTALLPVKNNNDKKTILSLNEITENFITCYSVTVTTSLLHILETCRKTEKGNKNTFWHTLKKITMCSLTIGLNLTLRLFLQRNGWRNMNQGITSVLEASTRATWICWWSKRNCGVTYLSRKATSLGDLLRNTWCGWELVVPAGRSRPLFGPSPFDPPQSR